MSKQMSELSKWYKNHKHNYLRFVAIGTACPLGPWLGIQGWAWHQQKRLKKDDSPEFEGINSILCLMVYLTAHAVMARPDKRRTVRPWIIVTFVAIFAHWVVLVRYDGSQRTVESKFKEFEVAYAIITTVLIVLLFLPGCELLISISKFMCELFCYDNYTVNGGGSNSNSSSNSSSSSSSNNNNNRRRRRLTRTTATIVRDTEMGYQEIMDRRDNINSCSNSNNKEALSLTHNSCKINMTSKTADSTSSSKTYLFQQKSQSDKDVT